MPSTLTCPLHLSDDEKSKRPSLPQRAVVTAGMPYGNKGLHFGHIGGVFVPADVWARFLRDRLGKDKLIFVSGTDCYGSPIAEGYRKACEAGFEGSIEDYVQGFHKLQKEALESYEISLSLYAGSALEPAKDTHAKLSAQILNRLHEEGELEKMSTLQFYDASLGVFLNGRQVQGRCPVQGCKSEKAYADECDLGHQFEPAELIAPISQLSKTKPELRAVDNFYFKLPQWREYVSEFHKELEACSQVRPVVSTTIGEFLGKPSVFIKNEFEEVYTSIKSQLPAHEFKAAEKGKASFELVFECYEDRDNARHILSEHELRFRTSKALVPFRLTGNIDWGVPAPSLEGSRDLTIWVWPESLWAPISFTQTYLDMSQKRDVNSDVADNWKDWWCSDDSQVYQFIGQDNIYFYGVAQPALFRALNWGLKQSILVANHHILFLGSKASSSGASKPPLAHELLEHYTSDQLRSHWISLGLDKKSVSFQPKVYDEKIKDDPRAADPALKEGTLFSNVFNRLARSVFYGLYQEFDGYLPQLEAADEVSAECKEAALKFEQALCSFEFTSAFSIAEDLIRKSSKRWASESKAAQINNPEHPHAVDKEAYAQALINAATALRFATLLMHPITPSGCEMIAEYFMIDAQHFFNWDKLFMSLQELLENAGLDASAHQVKQLPPRTDFFRKHESQY